MLYRTAVKMPVELKKLALIMKQTKDVDIVMKCEVASRRFLTSCVGCGRHATLIYDAYLERYNIGCRNRAHTPFESGWYDSVDDAYGAWIELNEKYSKHHY